jgi:hypothetical protein
MAAKFRRYVVDRDVRLHKVVARSDWWLSCRNDAWAHCRSSHLSRCTFDELHVVTASLTEGISDTTKNGTPGQK